MLLAVLVILVIHSCKKQLWIPQAPSEALIAKAKSFYTKQVLALNLKDRQVMDANAQGSRPAKRKSPAPIWENATLQTTSKGETILTVPISKYQLDNDKLDYTRKFVLSENEGEIVGGKIIEVYGSPELIAEHGEEMIAKSGEKQISGFTGLIIGYDLNYDFKDGKYYKNGVAKKGTAYVGTKRPDTTKKETKQTTAWLKLTASKDLNVSLANKPAQKISSFVPVFEDGFNCDYYYRVYIERDEYGQITYWENLGFAYRICTPTGDPNQPGGIREFFLDCAGVLNGGASNQNPCGLCIGGTTGVTECPVEVDSVLKKIVRDHCLTDGQLTLLNEAFNGYISGQGYSIPGCVQSMVFQKMKIANKKIGFCIDSLAEGTGNGFYVPTSETFFWKSGLGIGNVPLFGHEIFHAYQDSYYSGGTNQYGNNGFPNIEFERALLDDFLEGSSNATAMGGGAPNSVIDEYREWLKTITANNTKFPKQFSDFGGQYYYFLGLFYQYSVYPGKGTINTSLQPNALLNIFSSITCK